jgi:L-threonylcarbamoyladenylate synthase
MTQINQTETVELLKNGEVVIVPTDTVFGMAADYKNLSAIKKIYELKGRAEEKPLAILVGSQKMLGEIVKDVRAEHELLMGKFWPGGLTLIFRKKVGVSDLITAGGDRVGVRMPAHQGLLEVIRALGRPIVATSVNKSGQVSLSKAEDIKNEFPGISIMENAEEFLGIESTVLDLSGEKPKLLREKAISKQQLEEILGVEID